MAFDEVAKFREGSEINQGVDEGRTRDKRICLGLGMEHEEDMFQRDEAEAKKKKGEGTTGL